MIRLRRILEEPVIGPLGERCYFMTSLADYGDPFERIPGVISGPNYVHDDGSPLLPNEFGLLRRLDEQLSVEGQYPFPDRDDLVLWPTSRQWVAWRLRGQHFDKPTVSRMFADYGRMLEAQS